VAQTSNDTAAAWTNTDRQTNLGLGSATWAEAGIAKKMKINASEKYLMPSPLANFAKACARGKSFDEYTDAVRSRNSTKWSTSSEHFVLDDDFLLTKPAAITVHPRSEAAHEKA
jgi:hypothetical protein